MIFSEQLHLVRNTFVSVVLVTALTFAYTVINTAHAREPAPVVDATAQPTSSDLAARLEKIERRLDNQSMMEVLSRLDQLQQEMQNIIGQMEVLNYEMDNIKKRQKDLYVDIDRRITQVEQRATDLSRGQSSSPTIVGAASVPSALSGSDSPATSSSSTASGAPPVTAMVSPQTKQLQREAYDRAFNLLKDGRYELAIASFKAYLETYPNADYADNAQYWLGEANYAQRRYDVALQEFNKVLDNFPKSTKRADAMLKMGFSYIELGKTEDAEAVLGNIVTMFPDTTAARLAKKRIQDLKRR
ncbi:tol-pal system protein YbgF [Kaarinaea lacus]